MSEEQTREWLQVASALDVDACERAVPDPRFYAVHGERLRIARALHAREVTLELDEGTFRMSIDDALQAWEDLAPGEGFLVTSIHFDGELDG